MSSNKEYHDFLKFLYFEGYADSYEEAEELVESLSDDEIEYLYEARRKRKLAHSFPLTKKELKYVDNIRRRLDGEIVPAEGDKSPESRGREPSPTRSASKKRSNITFDDRSQASDQGNTRRTRSLNAEFDLVADYLFSEGYADSLDGAEAMAENISDNWVNEILNEKYVKELYPILEVKGRGRVSFRGNTNDRGMPLNPSMKLYRKKIKLETDMEREEDRIRRSHNAGDGQHDDYTQSDYWRPERVSRGERGRRASAQREIENSPKMKRLQSRWNTLSNVERKN